jgi:hypothetical protein
VDLELSVELLNVTNPLVCEVSAAQALVLLPGIRVGGQPALPEQQV